MVDVVFFVCLFHPEPFARLDVVSSDAVKFAQFAHGGVIASCYFR